MKKSVTKGKSGNKRGSRTSAKSRNSHSMASHSGNGRAHSASLQSRSNGRIKMQPPSEKWLKDFLSEMHAVEEGGEKLYRKALDELQHEELRDQLEEFHEETQRHIQLTQQMMQAAGVEEGYMSPTADAAQQKAEGLLSVRVEDELRDTNNIENLVLAETKDHWNWEMISSIAGKLQNRELRDVAKKAVAEVFKQEREHLQWNQETLTELAMEKAQERDAEAMEQGAEQYDNE